MIKKREKFYGGLPLGRDQKDGEINHRLLLLHDHAYKGDL